MSNTSHSVLPSLHAKLPYDPLKDFSPVSLVALTHSLLLVNPALPVKNVKELIELARAQPGKLNYASVGRGSPQHLAMAMFASAAGIQLTHVPYKGATQAATDVAGGQIPVGFQGLGTVTAPGRVATEATEPTENAGREGGFDQLLYPILRRVRGVEIHACASVAKRIIAHAGISSSNATRRRMSFMR